MEAMGVSRQVDGEETNFRLARYSPGALNRREKRW
jgi:hypothetical protein